MEDWIRLGDRSHPNLKRIDQLKRELNYDGHEKDLAELEEAHFEGNSGIFDDILHRIHETDKISRGDRSHPNLVRLDTLIRSVKYDGWRDDLLEAEQCHLRFPFLFFQNKLKKIKRKHKISLGDRSDEDLKFLDSLQLSYPNWRKDWQQAFDTYIEGNELTYETFVMQEKQRMHEGDRSHPRLVALDSLRLTYPGWERDAKEFELRHSSMDNMGMDSFETFRDYKKELESLRCKQSSYDFGLNDLTWMKPDQRTIVETQWTFPGCEEKVELVRKSTDECFDSELEEFRVRQMIHDGDYTSHPLLIKLASMNLTYPGWEDDFDECKRRVLSSLAFWKENLQRDMEGMKNKQAVYDGYTKSCSEKERSKPQAKNEETGLKECVVCWETTRSHVFVPCGHLAACKSCSDKIMVGGRKNCPVCNQVATMAMEVFHP